MIKIVSFGDKGSLQDERVGFQVTAGCDLKNFIVFKTHVTGNGFYNKSNDAYWFYPTAVEAGDRVVLYSKAGTDSIQKNDAGTTTYFRYWGLELPIFTDDEKVVVLLNAKSWSLSNKV